MQKRRVHAVVGVISGPANGVVVTSLQVRVRTALIGSTIKWLQSLFDAFYI